MNIGEAHDALVLLDFITRLRVWEYEPDPGGQVPDGLNESLLIGAAERLAERSHKALGAGMDAREVRDRLRAVGIGENLWPGQNLDVEGNRAGGRP